jgi:hypothetical protein
MILEEYRAKKLKELESWSMNMDENAYNYLKAFLSKTIDDLWKLPERLGENEFTFVVKKDDGTILNRDAIDGYDYCISEAERMRDLSIKGNG